MSTLSHIGIMIVQTIGSIYLLMVLLRFLLQLARADFYNPLSQSIVKATNPLLVPLRKMIPSLFGIDIACLLLALGVEFITVYLSVLLAGGLIDPLPALLWSGLGILSMTVYVFFICMIVMIILSFVAPYSRHPLAMLAVQLVRPICAPFQRLIPAIGGFDLSPIFVFLLLNIARTLIERGASMVGAIPQLVPGLLG